MIVQHENAHRARTRLLYIAWLLTALAAAWPLGVATYEKLGQSNVEARERLTERRKARAPHKVQPASVLDRRYLPPDAP